MTVVGNADGAGIGGGDSGSGGDVTVYAGKLTATGGNLAAGIGGGLSASQYGAVTIWGGQVIVTGGKYGAGIGGGQNFNDEFGNAEYGGNGGQVNVLGGQLIAKGGLYAAAIGGGYLGSGGSLQVSGNCEIIATAGAKSKSDKVGIQAIGRGKLSTKRTGDAAQTEGRVVLSDKATVTAGANETDAKTIASYKRLEGCRMSYAHIVAKGSLSHTITKQINQVLENEPTDKIDVQDLSGKSIESAKSGEQFRVMVTLKKSKLESLVATYTDGGEEKTLLPDKKSETTDTTNPTNPTNLITWTFTMPAAIDGVVSVKARVVRQTFTLSWPDEVEHGQVSVKVDGVNYEKGPIEVPEGTKVRMRTKVSDNDNDYFIQKIEAKGAEKFSASLVNDTQTSLAKGDTEDEWTFLMPAEKVNLSFNFKKGCYYVKLDGDRDVRHYFHTLSGDYDRLTMDGEGSEAGWYIVPPNTTVNVSCRVDVTANVNLILCDGSKLNANDGIFVARRLNAGLTIWAQDEGSGSIYADATDTNWAGIGGNSSDSSGDITINGGKIEAKGGRNAPGIGSGQYGSIGKITINVPRGKKNDYTRVTATGGRPGAGIGGGEDANGAHLVINGGTIYAYGGHDAAGIGGGDGGSNDYVEVNGGYVEAHGGDYGAGIGGGNYYHDGGAGGTVVINGGETKAYGGVNGAGVGGGEDGDAANVTVTGGYLYAEGGEYAAGIGGGENKPGGTFKIYGGRVNAYGGRNAVGIGGAEDEKGGDVYFYGGYVLAGCSGDFSTAIGGGKGEGDDGSIYFESNMCVRGASSFDAVRTATPVSVGSRDSTCKHNKYAYITPCGHSSSPSYTQINATQHETRVVCAYCAYSGQTVTESHRWGEQSETLNKCTQCGYNRMGMLTVDFTHLANMAQINVDGERFTLMNAEPFNAKSVIEGKTVQLTVTPAKNYDFKNAKVTYTRNSANVVGVTSASAIPITETLGKDGTYVFSFTMPAGDLTLGFETTEPQYKAYVSYRNADNSSESPAAMGSAVLSEIHKYPDGDCGTWSAAENIYTSKSRESVAIDIMPTEGYAVKNVRVYKRKANGSNGSYVKITNQGELNQFVFDFTDSDVNVEVSFQTAKWATVYHVIQAYDPDEGAMRWPTSQPEPLEAEALGSYIITSGPWSLEYPENYKIVGYRWNSYSNADSGITRCDANTQLSIDGDELYVYCKPADIPLNIYTENYASLRYTCTVPYGMPLLTYLQTAQLTGVNGTQNRTGVQPIDLVANPKSGVSYHWNIRLVPKSQNDTGKGQPVTANTTMPNSNHGTTAYMLLPVEGGTYVHVLLDVNGYDVYADQDFELWGDYWNGRDRYGRRPDNQDNGRESDRVYMDETQVRSFRVEPGAPLPEAARKAMYGAIRPGWKLLGWEAAGKDFDPDKGLIEDYQVNAYYTYDSGADKGRRYTYIILRAKWALRDAVVEYDADGGCWDNGDTCRLEEVSLGNTFTIPSRAESPFKDNGGWILSEWVLASTGKTCSTEYTSKK